MRKKKVQYSLIVALLFLAILAVFCAMCGSYLYGFIYFMSAGLGSLIFGLGFDKFTNYFFKEDDSTDENKKND